MDENERDPVWGPMSHPIRETIEDGRPPWRDHIWFGFWDPLTQVAGELHWNTSPNSPTGKAQFSVAVQGSHYDRVEAISPEATRYRSDGTEFDLRSDIRIDTGRVKGHLTLRPRFSPVNYTALGLIPPLEGEAPLEHYQQGVAVSGELVFDGTSQAIDALGFRTRTWGFRDESLQWPEYFSLQACFSAFDVTVMKVRRQDGSLPAGGYLIRDDHQVRITDVHITRDPSSLSSRPGWTSRTGPWPVSGHPAWSPP